MQINTLNRKGLLHALPLLGIAAVGAGFVVTFSSIGLQLAVATLFVCGAVYVSYYNQLNTSLQDTVLAGMGFAITQDSSALAEYALSRAYRMDIHRVYVPTTATYPFTLIRFTLARGGGKNKIVQQYIGCEFITQQEHASVQLFDRKNPFQPDLGTDRQLESTEFNRLFNMYSAVPSAPFYFLDPDTMSDLIDLKNSSGMSINMESFQNRIFVYTHATEVTALVKSGLSFSEILNGEIGKEKQALYQQSVEQFIIRMQTIFSTLDYAVKA